MLALAKSTFVALILTAQSVSAQVYVEQVQIAEKRASFFVQSIGCYVTGECFEPLFITVVSGVTEAEQCLLECDAVDACRNWTWYINQQDCFLYENCPEFSANAAAVSGDDTCPLQSDVWVQMQAFSRQKLTISSK